MAAKYEAVRRRIFFALLALGAAAAVWHFRKPRVSPLPTRASGPPPIPSVSPAGTPRSLPPSQVRLTPPSVAEAATPRFVFRARANAWMTAGATKDGEVEALLSFTRAYQLPDGRFLTSDPDGHYWKVMDAKIRERWLARIRKPVSDDESAADFKKPWHERSGVKFSDVRISAVMVRTTVAELSAELSRLGVRATRDAIGKRIELGSYNAVAFSLPGNAWTEVITADDVLVGLPRRLSEEFGDVVSLNYEGERYGFAVWVAGKRVEFYDSGIDYDPSGPSDLVSAPVFRSELRAVDDWLLEDERAFASETMTALGVIVPDFDCGYFVPEGFVPGTTVVPKNEGQVLTFSGGREVRRVPVFERLDFLVLDALVTETPQTR